MFEYLEKNAAHENHVYFKDMIDYFGDDLEKDEESRLWERSWDITFGVLIRSAVFGVVRRWFNVRPAYTPLIADMSMLDDPIIAVYQEETEATDV